MVDFDYSKVYTAVNADKLKIGSKVYVAKTFTLYVIRSVHAVPQYVNYLK